MRLPIAAACVLLLAGFAGAQYRDRVEPAPLAGLVLDPDFSINRGAPLLDPSRMRMSHSVSMGVVSGGGGSVSSGTYLNQLDYRLSGTMDLRLNLGLRSVMHNSYWQDGTGRQLIGGAEFLWRPTDSFRLHIAAGRGLPANRGWTRGWDPWGE
jgi:hypothetical protein